MQIYFSGKTRGFYNTQIHTNMPDDVVEIDSDTHKLLLSGEAAGKSICMDENGKPYLEDIQIGTRIMTALKRLESSLHQYIFIEHNYPAPTQATIQALVSDPETPQELKDKCLSVPRWIQQTVLTYYYRKKAAIQSSDTPESEVWDFAAECDSTAPNVTLSCIIKGLDDLSL